ncbi:lipid II flippase MurJ [Spirillospora sp. NPDC047279]|uniref:lipid II flippase MurJ n=1 Tax=Spirillospora sp. NPDC047279 TaxID=3155478 RepID=UPI00340CD5E2
MSTTLTHRLRRKSSIGWAAATTAVLVCAGTGMGFVRDLVMAHLFGASSSTDAFLVAWTVPETMSPLLIEDAMALIMVPIVARRLRHRDGVRPLVATALPRLAAALAAAMLLVILAAPLLVEAIAPGLEDAAPAVTCVRIAAVTILCFGITGFMSATLRAHHVFAQPAAIYLAYNVGILTAIAALAAPLGVVSAAVGVACGSVLMVAVQAPAFFRAIRTPPDHASPAVLDQAPAHAVALSGIIPVVTYTLTRQTQTLTERFLGSNLAAGAISHLNYAQKVAQVPMMLSLLIVTVTFPRLARATADGDTRQIRGRIEADLVIVGAIVLAATAYLIGCADQIVAVLFEHGRFSADDTASTATLLRIYCLGLWGQATLGVCARAYFSQSRPLWRPALAVAVSPAVTIGVGTMWTDTAGAAALAAANALGITLAAALLVLGLRTDVVRISLRLVMTDLTKLAAAALLAAASTAFVTGTLLAARAPLPGLVVNAAVVAAAFAAVLTVTGPSRSPLSNLRALRRGPSS